ncbi:hypothetical protein PHYBOEH_006475 [Phytophthora boehmeriae]|uniref:Uncharacterized protein n=1 Tax=Phytophthora boehmeriae TaxID=109152 RepID=A0A8T1WKA1_9STRA|nr:hypothetical protein PHYBOEH_006475 [Phytophthora boehmeriae]
MPTHKTASLVNLKAYVEYVIPQVDMLLGFERDRPFRKLRLKRYIFAKKKLRELCLALTEQGGRGTIVGFGDWSNNDLAGRIKRHPKAPVKPLERELKRYCTVKSIDEFRTSKLHADCHREMSHQYSLRLC